MQSFRKSGTDEGVEVFRDEGLVAVLIVVPAHKRLAGVRP